MDRSQAAECLRQLGLSCSGKKVIIKRVEKYKKYPNLAIICQQRLPCNINLRVT